MQKKTLALLIALSVIFSMCAVIVSAKDNYTPVAEGTYNGHTYQVFDESITWHEAKEKCEEMGGHLVIINSEKENSFVTELISGCGKNLYWIGCYLNRNVWCWVDGSELAYENWSVNEPNDYYGNDSEAYGHMFRYDYEEYDAYRDDHNKGEWNDLAAAGDINGYALDKIGFICEWDNIFSSFGSEISEWASDEIEVAYDKELIPESLVGEDLTQPITRAEFAAVSVKAYEIMANTTALPVINNPFTDTKDVDVLKAYNTGITTGVSATEFDPNALLNREQAATMLTRVFKRATMKGWTIETDGNFTLDYAKPAPFADDARISEWAKDSVYFMASNGIINGVGDNKFAPQNTTSEEEAVGYANATREQALIIATRMVDKLK